MSNSITQNKKCSFSICQFPISNFHKEKRRSKQTATRMTKGFTFTTILLFICTLVLVHSPQQVQGGVGCFAACAVACCEAGVFAFANPLGIAVGVTGCSGVCMVACATAAFVPPACFHQNTTIRLFNSDLEVPISSIKENDLVFDGSLTPAKVTRNALFTSSGNSSEMFDFRSITLSNNKTLTVTAEHGVIIMVSNIPTVVAAIVLSL